MGEHKVAHPHLLNHIKRKRHYESERIISIPTPKKIIEADEDLKIIENPLSYAEHSGCRGCGCSCHLSHLIAAPLLSGIFIGIGYSIRGLQSGSSENHQVFIRFLYFPAF